MDRLQESLDSDEMLIFPHLLDQFPELFESVRGEAYLIRDANDPNGELDWCWASSFERIERRVGPVEILAKQLVVRLTMPWFADESQFTISEEEFLGAEFRDEYEVMDTFVRAKDQLTGYYGPVDKLDFQQNRERYTDETVEYSVRWKPIGHNPRGIDPENVYTVLSE